MSEWSPSCYNIVTKAGDGMAILFNTATGATLYYPKNEYDKDVAPLLQKNKKPVKFDEQKLAMLAGQGFVHPKGHREIDVLKQNYSRGQHRGEQMSLTIVPSQDCNFVCPYCFEKDKSGRMTKDTAHQVVEFCNQWIYHRTELFLCWYGGEPLLALDILSWISAKLKPLLKKKECRFQSTIITNGYLLDEHAVKSLLRAGVSSAQVTLDGDEKHHNEYRYLKDHTPTYRTIFDHIVAAARAGLYISLRINAGKHNQSTVFSVLNEVAKAGIQKRISVSLGRLDDLCNNSHTARQLALSNKKFADLEYRLLLHLLTLGFPVQWKSLMPRSTYCSAVRPSFLMISHDGTLCKCWNRAGNEMEPVGHVSEPCKIADRHDPHLLWDPFAVAVCRECSYFPLCVGGCPDRNLREEHKGMCDSIRFNLKKQLQLRYLCQRTGLTE